MKTPPLLVAAAAALVLCTGPAAPRKAPPPPAPRTPTVEAAVPAATAEVCAVYHGICYDVVYQLYLLRQIA